MSLVPYLFIGLLLTSCAWRGGEFKSKYAVHQDKKILDIPFIAQANFYCGPATLAMISNHLGQKTTAEELSQLLYTPGSKGTFQTDLIATTRRLGLLALPVDNMKGIFFELAHDRPILVFQNLGLSWIPRWHYALVVGHDLKRNEMILHSGKIENFRLKISTFERTWKRAGKWGLIVVRPGTLPDSASELAMIKATAGLELAGQFAAAKISYEKILEKWPQSFGALIGSGNVSYQLNDLIQSRNSLHKATELYPKAAGAWHNYALVLMQLKQMSAARKAAEKAIQTADSATAQRFRAEFKSLLN